MKQTVDILLPQLTPSVELLICDNCSNDGTLQYLRALQPLIRIYGQISNVGADYNMISCLEQANGRYVWLLCDDDLPCSNAVAQILEAISDEKAGMISLQAKGSDSTISDYSYLPVNARFESKDRDGFLHQVGEALTFASNIVVRKDCIDFDFLRSQCGTFLVPAAIALQSAGTTNCAMIPDKPLLYGRSGNVGGYDAFTVFSKNLRELLKRGKAFGYKNDALDAVYRSALAGVLPYIVRVWPVSVSGFGHLVRYSIGYREFYTKLLPCLFRAAADRLRRAGNRVVVRLLIKGVKQLVYAEPTLTYTAGCSLLDDAASLMFTAAISDLGPRTKVRHPVYLHNPKYVSIGADFTAEPGLRIEAIDEQGDDKRVPNIKIGKGVFMGWNVHIGAMNCVDIGDNVTLGSHVLITDHSHGSLCVEELDIAPMKRKLVSKGPVIIERNVWIGEGACILPGVRIGAGAVIGANAVVAADVPQGRVVGGVPARILRSLS